MEHETLGRWVICLSTHGPSVSYWRLSDIKSLLSWYIYCGPSLLQLFFFFGSRFLCVRSVHKPFFSSAHDQDINSLKVYKKGGCNIPNTIMYILVLPNPCIINYDSNIFPRSSQIKPNLHIIQYKYWVKLAIFSSTVKFVGKFKNFH